MEKIIKEKRIKNKDILTQDCNNTYRKYNEIKNKQITGLRKQKNKDLIMDRRKRYSQNNKNFSLIVEEELSSKILEDINNLPLVFFSLN
jgi:hypothetical protein